MQRDKYLLGISCFYHDSSVALISQEGKIIYAIDEERLSGIKHDKNFPLESCKKALIIAGGIKNIEKVCYYENSREKLERVALQISNTKGEHLENHIEKILAEWKNYKLNPEYYISESLNIPIERIWTSSHHLSHVCSSVMTSGLGETDFITFDGVGEITTGLSGNYNPNRNNEIQIYREQVFPHSLGLFYTAITQYLGFEVNEGEFKVMGLAPYGEALYINEARMLFKNLDGMNSKLNMKYFSHDAVSDKCYTSHMEKLFGLKAKPKEIEWDLDRSQQLKKYADVAASCQSVLEEIVFSEIKYLKKRGKGKNLCMSGGIFYNSVLNGRINRESGYTNIYAFPAVGDSGNAVGAALAYLHFKKKKSIFPKLDTIYLGDIQSKEDIERFLLENKIDFINFLDKKKEASLLLAKLLSQGHVIAIYQGRDEYGPRALGNRSILADPRSTEMKDIVNRKIKYREPFRPFAPAVIEEYSNIYFDYDGRGDMYRYMQCTAQVNRQYRDQLKAVTHVDNSARIQVVTKESNEFYYGLINDFGSITKVYCLLNTSFNVKGEPMVSTLHQALSTFYRTEIDAIYLDGAIVLKNNIKL